MKYNREEIRERYRDLFEKSLDLIYVHDLKGKILDANDIFLNSLGYTREEIQNLSFIHLIDDEQLKKAYKITKEIMETGKQLERSEYKLKTKNGKYIYVETYGFPLKKNGKIYAILGIANDITERKLTEQKLKESEEIFKALFKGGLVPTYTWQKIENDFKLINYNNAAEKFTLGDVKNYSGIKASEMYIDRPDILKDLHACFDKKINIIREMKYYIQILKEEKDLLVKYGFVPPDLVLVHTEDNTERKRAEFLIKEEIKKLKELDQIRKNLIMRVSHELKTPLIPVCGGTELLLDKYKDQLEKEVNDIIKMIGRGGHRLKILINKLLDLSRLEYNMLALEKQTTDLSKLIKEISSDMMHLVKNRDLTLKLEITDSLDLDIDALRIEQVITNLLSNAIKNTPPKGIITINLQKEDNWAKLIVKDTGVGLTEMEMNTIFNRFGKIERHEKGLEYIDITGSGLGLFISKEIIDLHGGKIWVESLGRNKGCTFYVKLPIK